VAGDDGLNSVIASEAKQSIASNEKKEWIASAFARRVTADAVVASLLAMTASHSFAISPRVSREVCHPNPALSNQRAQGMPGARCARKPRVHK
jgi:hypothetical protein